ncbi:MAG: hypothetical protein IKN54_05595, partial [Lachnospiraceae bacterium]|nr:hypothetical protein [Lachnospiraceae bacterium]
MKKIIGIIGLILIIVFCIAVIMCIRFGLIDTFRKVVNQSIGTNNDSGIDTLNMDSLDGDSQTFDSKDVDQLVLNCQYGTFNVKKNDEA